MKKLYEQRGWSLQRINGSHHIMKKGVHIESIHRNKELKPGMLKSLLKTLEEVG